MTKEILPGTFRWIGQQVSGIGTLDVPIGTVSAECVVRHTGGTSYRVGRIFPSNAFVVERSPLRLLYVRRDYRGYRAAAGHVFADCHWTVDYDHALGRKLAEQLNYRFVLLVRLTPRANRSHGAFERRVAPDHVGSELCFADRRIVDKWLGRPPRRMNPSGLIPDYTNSVEESFGLTLKQAGVWGYAMGEVVPVSRLFRRLCGS
ncbi:hypothetical protein OH818_20650 [Jiella pelagia]|uniref:Uncharacterized protein n=1 Tax=Jiella pelagia TaxID=2986949 RepID=A0ABY7BWP9_9HYPH|nr:hypothetical protein OH818_20650 [Jiella pelagia]